MSEVKNIIERAKKNNYQIIMTEKDYYKFKQFKFDNINYLKIILKVENKERLIDKIKKLYV